MTQPDPALLTDEIVTILTSATGLLVGDAEAPALGARPFTVPYLVVYPLSDFFTDGDLAEPNRIASAEWQVTSVGEKRVQAQWGLVQARTALVDTGPADPAGFYFSGKPTLEDGPVERDDDIQPPLFYAVGIFRFLVGAA